MATFFYFPKCGFLKVFTTNQTAALWIVVIMCAVAGMLVSRMWMFVRCGDEIMEINDTVVCNMTLNDVYTVLSQCSPGPVQIIISRHPDPKVGLLSFQTYKRASRRPDLLSHTLTQTVLKQFTLHYGYSQTYTFVFIARSKLSESAKI